MTLGLCITAFAGTWKSDDTGWWWQRDDGSWPANVWEWCDGNGDGVAECYYFNGEGYCLLDTKTPDGYTVNADGAWVENGEVVTKETGSASGSADTSSVCNLTPSDQKGYSIVSNVTVIDGSTWPEAIRLEFTADEGAYVIFNTEGKYSEVSFKLAAPQEKWPDATYCFFSVGGDITEIGKEALMFIDGMSQKENRQITYEDTLPIEGKNQVSFEVYPEFDSDRSGYVYLTDIKFK